LVRTIPARVRGFSVERDLRGGHVPTTTERRDRAIAGVVYARLKEPELAHVFDEAFDTRARVGPGRPWGGIRPPWDDGLWHLDGKTTRDLSLAMDADWATELLTELGVDHHERLQVLGALASSDIVAFEPAGHESGQRLWNVYWCLAPLPDLPEAVAQELRSSSLRFFEESRVRANGERWFTRGAYAFAHGSPNHLRVDGAPVAVVAVGQVQRFPMPSGLAVPTNSDSIRDAVILALTRLSEAARYGLDDAWVEGEVSEEDREGRRPPGGWLDQNDGSYRVHPDVLGACAFVRQAANRLLPGFLAEHYELIVETRAIQDWFKDGPLRLMVRPRGTSGDDDFKLEDVADGLRLWLQLALLEAAEQTRRVQTFLDEIASDWCGQAQAANDAIQHEDPDADGLQDLATTHERQFQAAVTSLRNIPEVGWVTGELAGRLALRPATDVLSRAARDRRWFIVDEPERHLHPGLQREAARWLSETAADRAAPALLATHSTAFLSLPVQAAGLTYVYCSRDGLDSTVRRFDLAELQDLDRVGAEMGFDRGELLATVALFLVVEGRHDAEVLTRAFRSELADAHVAVVPMEGASQYAAVLDSQALWRYTSAKVAVATDKFTPERFTELMGDDKQLAALRRSDAPEETKALAKLMGNARHQGKQIHLLGHAEDDLLDAIDEDIVISAYERYPGHVQARRLWSEEQQLHKLPAARKKIFYEERLAIPNNVTTYQRLGDDLAAKNRRPAALARIVAAAAALVLAG
jgi:AAA domain, putative AbiEii toxin, Type IV TA system